MERNSNKAENKKRSRRMIDLAKFGKFKTPGIISLMCLWVFAVMKAAGFVVVFFMSFILGREQLIQPVWTAVSSIATYVISVALIIFAPLGCYKKWGGSSSKKRSSNKKDDLDLSISRVELGLKGWPTWTDIGLSVAGVVVALLLAAGLVFVFSFLPWFDANQAQDVGFNAYMSGTDRILAFITLIVVAPIVEEVIFRGWLYGKIRQRLSTLPEWSGILISTLIVSALFGIMHGQWNVGVNVFCLSVVACVLREITGTIYAGILTHMIRNGLAFFLLYVIGIG